MKFRIEYIKGEGYYPQVLTSNFLWFKVWRTIGRHPHGKFGLYETNSYPISHKRDAVKRIEDYKVALENQERKGKIYFDSRGVKL